MDSTPLLPRTCPQYCPFASWWRRSYACLAPLTLQYLERKHDDPAVVIMAFKSNSKNANLVCTQDSIGRKGGQVRPDSTHCIKVKRARITKENHRTGNFDSYLICTAYMHILLSLSYCVCVCAYDAHMRVYVGIWGNRHIIELKCKSWKANKTQSLNFTFCIFDELCLAKSMSSVISNESVCPRRFGKLVQKL